ncbi:hypothetical protein ACOMHN_020057 [Nucella lapillus]
MEMELEGIRESMDTDGTPPAEVEQGTAEFNTEKKERLEEESQGENGVAQQSIRDDQLPAPVTEDSPSAVLDENVDLGASGDAPSLPQAEDQSLHQLTDSGQESAVEPMETEEPEGERAEIADEGKDQSFPDMGEAEQPQTFEQENGADTAVLPMSAETGEDSADLQGLDESGLMQENAAGGEGNQAGHGNEAAVGDSTEREAEDSAVGDTGDGDFGMSAEDEDKLLAEDNTQSLTCDSGNTPAAGQELTTIPSTETEQEDTEKTDLNVCSETVEALGSSDSELEGNVENQHTDAVVEGDRTDLEPGRIQDGDSRDDQNMENTAEKEQDMGQNSDEQEQHTEMSAGKETGVPECDGEQIEMTPGKDQSLSDSGEAEQSEVVEQENGPNTTVPGETVSLSGTDVTQSSDASDKKENQEEEPDLQVLDITSEGDVESYAADPKKAKENSTAKAGQDSATVAASSGANAQSSKPTVVDDDDDDVVVLDDDDDDDDVAPGRVKEEKREVFDNSNEMGIQIASVSGGADELHKMAEQSHMKQENGNELMSSFTNSSMKTLDPPNNASNSSPSTSKKVLLKSQSCIVCKRVGKCKYNIVRNGDIKHLCDDTCFKRFRTNPSMFLKGTTNKPPPASGSMSQPKGRLASKPAAVVAQAPAPSPNLKTCAVCQIMNITNQGQFCMWKGMDFCGEGCLGKFQSGISTSCTLCKIFIPLTARSSNCLRLGNQIRPFCSARCYSDYKRVTKLCTFCHSDLGKVPDSFSAPVGYDATFKEFCSQHCMKQFEKLINSDVEIMKVEQLKQRGSTKCSVCRKMEKTKHAIKFSGVIHNLCSDPCLSAFRYANKLDLNTCGHCNAICSSLESTPHTLVTEGEKKRFCSDACLSQYRLSCRKVVPCSWCGSQRDNFDMIERLDSSNKYQLFCSLNCLSLFRVNLQAKSNQSVLCDHCRKVVPAQYHLTMSDASVRNFCSYNCVMTFQSQFAKGTPPPLPTPSLLSANPAGAALSSTHKHNTRRSTGSLQCTAAAAAPSVPIISSVISLAPQGNQTVNIKNSTGAPVLITKGSPGGMTGAAGTSIIPTQQKIIVQPPPPKVVKNKSLMCKPFTQTKATSCRPNAQTKECQTDEVRNKPTIVPVPVPIYLPTPMALYSNPAPTPIFIPVPIPVPVFIPTTRKSAKGIMKHIKEIMDKTPSDPLEAELLQMAAAVSEGGNKTDSDSDEEQDLPDITKTRKRPLPMDDDDDDDNEENVLALTSPKEGGDEDMISMAMRMAEEITDLETAVEAVPVSTEAPAGTDKAGQEELRIQRSSRRPPRTTTTSRAKRQRLQDSTETAGAVGAVLPQEPAAPPADLNFRLKFSYGVNAWRHWVRIKNTHLEENRKPAASGRAKLFKADILQCTAEELNFSLCLFVKEVRKPTGDEYSPDSIYYLTIGLQQYLYENGRIDNIFADHYYEPFTRQLAEILSTCQPKFNSEGQMVCRIEEEHLWECKQLGAHSPYVLLNTLIYFHTKYFMLKTPEEHLKLSFAHILKYWKKGMQPVKGQPSRSVSLRYYSVSSAKKDASAMVSTTKRGSKDGIPVFEVAENTDNPLRCPVKLYEFFLSKCPESIKNRSDIFYPVPERSCVPDSPVWYSTIPLGEDVMTRMLTRILLVREIQEAHLHSRPIYV